MERFGRGLRPQSTPKKTVFEPNPRPNRRGGAYCDVAPRMPQRVCVMV